MLIRSSTLVVALTSLSCAAAVPTAHAADDSARSFYQGKQIRFFTMGSPGGGYDTYTRTVVAYLERKIGAKRAKKLFAIATDSWRTRAVVARARARAHAAESKSETYTPVVMPNFPAAAAPPAAAPASESGGGDGSSAGLIVAIVGGLAVLALVGVVVARARRRAASDS